MGKTKPESLERARSWEAVVSPGMEFSRKATQSYWCYQWDSWVVGVIDEFERDKPGTTGKTIGTALCGATHQSHKAVHFFRPKHFTSGNFPSIKKQCNRSYKIITCIHICKTPYIIKP